jgi:hypothetical protein
MSLLHLEPYTFRIEKKTMRCGYILIVLQYNVDYIYMWT